MIIKSKDLLTRMIQESLPEVDQITLETSPDVSSGSGVKLLLDSSKIEPVTGAISNAVVGWRIVYYPRSSESESEAYVAYNTLIESLFDKPVWLTPEKVPFKMGDVSVVRTSEELYLKLIMSTTLNKNTKHYDSMKDVNVSIGG